MDEGRDFVDRHLRAYLGQLSPSLSGETIRHKTQMTRDFLAHLAAIGVTDLRGIDPDVVYAYVGSLDYAPQTRSGLKFQLREVFDGGMMGNEGVSELIALESATHPIDQQCRRLEFGDNITPNERDGISIVHLLRQILQLPLVADLLRFPMLAHAAEYAAVAF